jgi:hypothetical protein
MPKTLDQYFIDWESHVLGYGYGTGEDFIIPELKKFFSAIGRDDQPNAYWHTKLEEAVGPVVAWLFINLLCHADVIEYGTSPRGGWLTEKGENLKQFIDGKSASELFTVLEHDSDYIGCFPDYCNCTTQKGENPCGNPFF